MIAEFAFRRVTRPAAVLALGAGALLVPAPPALAEGDTAVAGVIGAKLIYTAGAAQTNRLTVTMSPGASVNDQFFYRYTIDDAVNRISAGTGCAYPDDDDHTKVVCSVEARESQDPYVIAKFDLGDQYDTLKFVNQSKQAYSSNEFWLGTGNDEAVTAQPGGSIDGSGVYGQKGQDKLTTGSIGDGGGVWGGNNNDTIHVSGNTGAHGGNGDDKIYADLKSQSLRGDDGNDLIEAGGGSDSLYGGRGDDRLYGQTGADQIYGNSGNDGLYGGPGTDTISGGPGRDSVKQD